jgi:hypothetical protein
LDAQGSIIERMGKWALGFILVLLSCIPIYLQRSTGASLLEDMDTRVLLATIRQRDNPLSWFTGDWPLGNHFYRPVSTLTFELDNRLYGNNAAGYGLTNAFLCIACVLLLFWFLRELTDRIEIAVPGTLLFALWQLGNLQGLAHAVWWAGLAVLGLALLPQRPWKLALLACLTLLFVSDELSGIAPLKGRMIDWLPGRTASVMTLFALLALASYCRYERISAGRLEPPEPGPLDPPATKGTAIRPEPNRLAGLWVILSIIATAFALGSYEQAIMVPALLFGAALCLRLQRYQVRWAHQAVFWGLLLGYFVLRSWLVPSDVSGYQAQQFRSGPGVISSILEYFVPAAPSVWQSFAAYDIAMFLEYGGVIGPVAAFPLPAVVAAASNVGAFLAARKDWLFPLAAWAMSGLAFLPMAWLKHFDHYHYLPMALRAFFVVAMGSVALNALVSAASRPALQAPPRLDLAPGSLPHP